jgi:hypothetical protein
MSRLSSLTALPAAGEPAAVDAEEDEDARAMAAALAGARGAQMLTSVLNDPNVVDESLWPLVDSLAGFLGLATEASSAVPPLAPGVLPEVSAADFAPYLRSLSHTWPAFVAAREASRAQRSAAAARGGSAATGARGAPRAAPVVATPCTALTLAPTTRTALAALSGQPQLALDSASATGAGTSLVQARAGVALRRGCSALPATARR